MEKWLVHAKKADFYGNSEKFGINPVTARIIRNRDIIEDEDIDEYLKCDLSTLYSPFLFKDMEKAVNIIINSIISGEKIRVIGDYDIDGVCSGYILTTGLERMGARVDFDVPDRIMDGYGLNERLIRQAYSDGVELIITCDNGIAADSQVKLGRELGMKIVVTDHHEVPYEMIEGEKKYKVPLADAVIDHKQEECGYPFKELCGGAVAYKVIEAIFDKVTREDKYKGTTIFNAITGQFTVGKSESENKFEFMKEFLAFAGIATVGDIVVLIKENRTIVKNALKIINEIDNPGLEGLIKANGLEGKKISSYHIGFVIGPCINAGGRLETAKKAFDLFRERDRAEAAKKANELKKLNDERKFLTQKYTEIALVEADKMIKENDEKVLVMYLKECHESLAGIIAGKIKEHYYRPSFVLTAAEDGAKGSGRGIEDYSMFDELVLANSKYMRNKGNGEPLFKKFGGHKMAAGLSIAKDKIEDFRRLINDSEGINEEVLTQKVWIDVPMPFEYITEKLIMELEKLEPHGTGNEKPVFAEKCTKIRKIRIVGVNRNVVILSVANKAGFNMEATLFEDGDTFLNNMRQKFSDEDVNAALEGRYNNMSLNVIYYPEINEYRGIRNIRVVVKRYS